MNKTVQESNELIAVGAFCLATHDYMTNGPRPE